MLPERIDELLSYNRETGLFTWKVSRRGHAKAGQVAGSLTKFGYIVICVDGGRYFAHRLAWLVVHRRWPEHDIDHINGVRADNRISNLRDVVRAVNLQNRRSSHRRSLSGLLGVKKNHNGWSAGITKQGVLLHLGTFKTPEQAHSAYIAAKRQFHEGNTL